MVYQRLARGFQVISNEEKEGKNRQT